MGFPEVNFISEQEYLAAERSALDKHEYFRGEIFAMSGASIPHNKISRNVLVNLANSLKGKHCEPFGSDLRIHIPENTLYTYPDISVICGEIETTDDHFDTATNPIVIIEILSKSTRNYDQGEKFNLYRQIASLKEYILIDSEAVKVIKHTRNEDDTWLLKEFSSINDFFTISSIQVTLNLVDVYENVKFNQ